MISLIADQPPAVVQYLRFIDYTYTIPSFTNKVSINPATTWTDFAGGLLQDNGELILVHISVARGREGQFILLDVVPEPASIALLACAVPAALLLRRRR
ncbi:MAG: PEP-CTERM sorting domain-containing protein [Pirellulales bacterium]|nr:PEP-CTERM sorting domain-containing protein [Pirellulales bacterium]